MDSRDKEEKKNKRIGWLFSVGTQLVLLLLFYFLVAWKAPFPPIPQFGIELGFMESSGAAPASTNEEVQQNPEDVTQSTEENLEEESSLEEPIEKSSEEVEEVPDLEEESDTPLETEEEQSSPQEEQVEEVVVQEETAEKDTKEEEAEEESIEETAEPTPDPAEAEPTIDDRAIYGSQGANTGTEEGASLALAGWIWDFRPEPEDDSDDSGRIVYRIVVDQDGYLVKIETITSTVSPAVERKYRAAVQKLTFSKTTEYKSAPLSTGTLTFIIKSR